MRPLDGRKRRIRRSLCTRDLERAIALRDDLFAHIREHGEFVAARRRSDAGLLCMRPIAGESIRSQVCLVGV